METSKEILGYTIRARRILIDPEKIPPEMIEDVGEGDLYTTFYICKNRHIAMVKPTDKSQLFTSVARAKDHLRKYNSEFNDVILGIIPIYKQKEGSVTIIRREEWVRPKEEVVTKRIRKKAAYKPALLPKLR